MSRHLSQEDLAAYAIGGLDGREERVAAKHLDRCEECAAELAEKYGPAVAVLAESVEQIEPPPELRQNLMATVREEAAADAGEGLGRGRAPRPSGVRGFLLRPAAGLAAVALGVAGVAGYLVADGGEGGQAETVALSSSASGVAGDLILDDGSATLRMEGMEPLEAGDVYQVWMAGPSGVEPSAAFVPDEDGTATAAVPEATGDVDRVLITREPMAGRQTPSGATVFDSRLN